MKNVDGGAHYSILGEVVINQKILVKEESGKATGRSEGPDNEECQPIKGGGRTP